MTPKKSGVDDGGPPAIKGTKRSRWATRKLTVKSSGLKRLALVGRMHNRTTSTEKKRTSAGTESLRRGDDPARDGEDGQEAQDDAQSESSESTGEPRQLYFNLPLPDELKDENGHLTHHFTRNKIRTAKYTPLSFIPKNLWFQFHNIANMFFFFLVILVVCSISSLPRLSLSFYIRKTAYSQCLDIPYLRWCQPWPKRSSPNCYYYRHCR